MKKGYKKIIIHTGDSTKGNHGYIKYRKVSFISKFRDFANSNHPKWIFFHVYDAESGKLEQTITRLPKNINLKTIIVNTGIADQGNKGFVKYHDVADVSEFTRFLSIHHPKWKSANVYCTRTKAFEQQITP